METIDAYSGILSYVIEKPYENKWSFYVPLAIQEISILDMFDINIAAGGSIEPTPRKHVIPVRRTINGQL